MKFQNDFVGHDKTNIEYEWLGSDNLKLFKKNLKKQPDDWYYKNLSLSYKYNDNGHRCKNIDEIDLDNYMLFIGCSHTEGVALELEKSFPYLISKELKCDYYNLALGGTGPDILEYNLVTWFAKIQKMPKAVIIQWPDHTRFASMNPEYPTIIPQGTWTDDENSKKMIVLGEETGYFNARKQICLNIIRAITKTTKVITLSFNNMALYNNDTLFIKRHDYARDLAHGGIKTHEIWAKQVLEHIS